MIKIEVYKKRLKLSKSEKKLVRVIKYILPAIIVLLIVIFWEKITEVIHKKFNIRLNYLIISGFLLVIAVIILLIRN